MISYYLPSGSKIGVGYQVHALANELVERGHRVTVFSPCRASDGSRYQTETFELDGSNRTFKFALRLRKVDSVRFDVFTRTETIIGCGADASPRMFGDASRQLFERGVPHQGHARTAPHVSVRAQRAPGNVRRRRDGRRLGEHKALGTLGAARDPKWGRPLSVPPGPSVRAPIRPVRWYLPSTEAR